jgi:hypothetical protein
MEPLWSENYNAHVSATLPFNCFENFLALQFFAIKKILRLSIQYHLDGKELKSKKVFKAIEGQGG